MVGQTRRPERNSWRLDERETEQQRKSQEKRKRRQWPWQVWTESPQREQRCPPFLSRQTSFLHPLGEFHAQQMILSVSGVTQAGLVLFASQTSHFAAHFALLRPSLPI